MKDRVYRLTAIYNLVISKLFAIAAIYGKVVVRIDLLVLVFGFGATTSWMLVGWKKDKQE